MEVSLNQGLATAILKAENRVRLSQLREAIVRNGFAVKEARLVVRGKILADGKLTLQVDGSGESFELALDPAAKLTLDALRGFSGQNITLEGTIDKLDNPNMIRVSSVQPAQPRKP